MKVLVLLFLIGCAASASLYDAVDHSAAEEHDLMFSLVEDLDSNEASDLQANSDVTDEMKKKLRDGFHRILEFINDRIAKGKGIPEKLQKKIKKMAEDMKNLKIKIHEKSKEILRNIRDKVPDPYKDLIDYFLKDDDTSTESEYFEEAHLDFHIKDILRKLKEYLLTKTDKESLKAKIEELFGKGSDATEYLFKIVEKGDQYKQKILDLINRILGEREERSLKEYWEKVKNYFKDLHIDIAEKYFKFGEYVKEHFGKILDKGKDKLENIKAIAKEFIDHTKGVSKDVAVEALEFLRPYKEHLGSLWDQLKETVKDIINKKD